MNFSSIKKALNLKEFFKKTFNFVIKKVSRIKLVIVILVLLVGISYYCSSPSSSPSVSSSSYSSYVTSAAVGTIEGDFSVTPDGSANYSFSIAVPPGTNAVAPNLSVSYNSQGQNGYLGQGFGLGGLSAIARCNYIKNYNQADFQRVGVEYSYTDHFCLDGDELKVTNDGDYGADGTEYRATDETWTKVTSYGTCGKGPCYFKAQNKDGTEIQFGKNSDSQILAQGREDGVVRVWAINRSTDLNGNYTEISYVDDQSSGEYYPDKITYTGNDTTGQLPQRSVNFIYEDRDDLMVGYIYGSKVTVSKRLQKIQTFVESDLVNSYHFNYTYSSTTKESITNSIEQCDAQGVCFPATTFGWINDFNAGEVSPDPVVTSVNEIPNGYETASSMMIDVNNDGFVDLVSVVYNDISKDYAEGDLIIVLLSDGKGNYSPSPYNGILTEFGFEGIRGYFGGDVDGNGFDDLVQVYSDNGKVAMVNYHQLAVKTSNDYRTMTTTSFSIDDSSFYSGDVNGDGRMDIVQAKKEDSQYTYITYLGKGDNTFTDGTQTTSGVKGDLVFFLADVNGDGNADFIQNSSEDSNLVIYTSLSDGLGGFGPVYKTVTGHNADNIIITSGDVNGDGKDDIIQPWNNDGNMSLVTYVSKGNGYFEAGIISDTGQNSGNIGVFTGDMNGDGKADVIQFYSDDNFAYRTYISNGDGAFYNGFSTVTNSDNDYHVLEVGDVDGDGKTDFIQGRFDGHSTSHLYNYLAKGTVANQMNAVVNGIGEEIAISYSQLTSGEIYSGGGENSYPIQTVISAMNVVSKYSKCDGSVTCDGVASSPNQYIYSFKYADAKYDMQRNLWLGFATFQTNDVANERYSIGSYNQTYPKNGLLIKNEVCSMTVVEGSAGCSRDGGSLMSNTTTSYINASSQADQNLDINQIVPSESSFSIYILGENTASSTATKKYQYDIYGNLNLLSDVGESDSNGDAIDNPDNYPLYSCTIYSNDLVNWRLGYVLHSKQEKNAQGCENFLANAESPEDIVWDSETDLSWVKHSYDENMNESSQSSYDDSNDVFLTTYIHYDSYGNIVSVVDPSGTQSSDLGAQCTSNVTQTCITYDSTYHTFPIQTQTPVTINGERLSTWKTYEPAFGQLVSATNVSASSAGEEAFTMFYEMDGFGRLVNTYGPNLSGEKTLISVNEFFTTDPAGVYVKTSSSTSWYSPVQDNWYWEENYADGMNREYLQRQRGLNNGEEDPVVKAISFNAQGHKDGETAAYFQSSNETNSVPSDWESDEWEMTCGDSKENTLNWVKVNYNIYNEPTCNTNPDGIQEKTSYKYVADDNMKILQMEKDRAYGTEESTQKSILMNSQQMVIQKIYPNGDIQYYKYDNLGRLIALTLNAVYTDSTCSSLEKGTTCFTYDSLGRKRSQTSSDSGTETYHYDSIGRLTSTVNANGDQILYHAYDNLNRLLSKTSSFTDVSGKTHSQTDNFTYDVADDAVNAKGSLAYLEGLDGDGKSIYNYTFSYDSYGNKVQNIVNVADLGSDPLTYSREYDPMGRLYSYTFPDGSVQRLNYQVDNSISDIAICDSANGVDCTSGNNSNIYASYSHYDANGNVQNIAYSNNQGKNIINISNQFYPGQGEISASGELIGTSYALKSITANSTNEQNLNLFSQQYNWNALNDITEIENLLSEGIDDQSFSYNDQEANQRMEFLTKAQGDYGVYEYHYDSVGNISSKTKDGSAINYVYNDKTNQIATGSDGSSFDYYDNGNLKQGTTQQDGLSYSYNTEGRITNISNATTNTSEYYIYDGIGNNIIRSISSPNKTNIIYYLAPGYEMNDLGSSMTNTKYVVGAEGVIAAITHDDSETVTSSSYHYHQNTANLLGLRDDFISQLQSLFHKVLALISHPEISSLVKSATLCLGGLILLVLLAYLICNKTKNKTDFATKHKNQVFVIPFLIFVLFLANTNVAYAELSPGDNGEGVPVAGMTRFFVKDQIGSIVSVTDENGLRTANISYLPYGAIDQANSNGTNDFRPKFSGNEWNETASLYNYGDRFYDPNIGRFISPDPAAQYSSPYIYAGNNPLSYIDADGDFAFIIVLVVAALAGGYAGGMAVNGGDPNPAQWDWNDGVTYAGIFGGAAIGLASAGAGAAIGMTYGVAAGTAAAVVLGAGENASYTAMGGGSMKDIGIAAAEGAAFSLAFEIGGAAMGRIASRFARQGASEAAEGAGKSFDIEMASLADDACSFTAGTKVETSSGLKNIELVKAGEKIFSYNFNSKKNGFYTVSETHNRQVDKIVTIHTAKGDEIKVTPEHPFWISKKRRFIAAGRLKTSDLLSDSEKNVIKITSIEKNKLSQGVRVYNFSVDQTKNFYVSENRILSHNCPISSVKSKKVGARKSIRKKASPDFYSDLEGGSRSRMILKPPTRPSFRKNIRQDVAENNNYICQLGGKGCAGIKEGVSVKIGVDDVYQSSRSGSDKKIGQVDHIIAWNRIRKANAYEPTYNANTGRWKWSSEAINAFNSIRNLQWSCFRCNPSKGTSSAL